MPATLVHLINALLEELDDLGDNVDWEVRRKLETLYEKLEDIDFSAISSLDTNMTATLQDAGIDGTVRREGNKLVVSTRISYAENEFVFTLNGTGKWFLTKARIRRRETKDSPIKTYLHTDLRIGGYTDEQMLGFARDVLTTGANTSLNRFFGVKLY